MDYLFLLTNKFFIFGQKRYFHHKWEWKCPGLISDTIIILSSWDLQKCSQTILSRCSDCFWSDCSAILISCIEGGELLSEPCCRAVLYLSGRIEAVCRNVSLHHHSAVITPEVSNLRFFSATQVNQSWWRQRHLIKVSENQPLILKCGVQQFNGRFPPSFKISKFNFQVCLARCLNFKFEKLPSSCQIEMRFSIYLFKIHVYTILRLNISLESANFKMRIYTVKISVRRVWLYAPFY